jgi:hypothetical protein
VPRPPNRLDVIVITAIYVLRVLPFVSIEVIAGFTIVVPLKKTPVRIHAIDINNIGFTDAERT